MTATFTHVDVLVSRPLPASTKVLKRLELIFLKLSLAHLSCRHIYDTTTSLARDSAQSVHATRNREQEAVVIWQNAPHSFRKIGLCLTQLLPIVVTFYTMPHNLATQMFARFELPTSVNFGDRRGSKSGAHILDQGSCYGLKKLPLNYWMYSFYRASAQQICPSVCPSVRPLRFGIR